MNKPVVICMFEVMLQRAKAGEPEEEILADYGYYRCLRCGALEEGSEQWKWCAVRYR